MAHHLHFGLKKIVAAAFTLAASAFGPALDAQAGQITGPGVVILPNAVVSGSISGSAAGGTENSAETYTTLANDTQNITVSGAGSKSFAVSEGSNCQCAYPGGGGGPWVFGTANANGSVNVSLSANPSIKATATIGVSSVIVADASAYVDVEADYYFEILDAGSSTAHPYVPITVNASGGYTYAVDTPGYEIYITNDYGSTLFVSSGPTDELDWSNSDDGTLAPGSKSWSENKTYSMAANEVDEVRLIAYLQIGTSGDWGGGSQTMSVYVDPTFSFGAGVDPSQYSLVFSPNLGGAVPEPSTWAMLLAGFTAIGVAGLRARATSFRRRGRTAD